MRRCILLQEHAQELAWQLGEAQRHFSEAQRERDKVKIESEQHLQTVRDAEVRFCHPIHATVSVRQGFCVRPALVLMYPYREAKERHCMKH